MSKYQDLLKQARASYTDPETLRTQRASVRTLLDEMGQDLSDVPLEDDRLVEQLIAAKFNESPVFPADGVPVLYGAPSYKTGMEPLGELVIGKYPKAAYKVHVVATGGGSIAVYISIVPKD